MKIVLSTKNPGKIAEMQSIINNSGLKDKIEIDTLASYPGIPDIIDPRGGPAGRWPAG